VASKDERKSIFQRFERVKRHKVKGRQFKYSVMDKWKQNIVAFQIK